MDLVSPVLRTDFREFCVTYLVLRQIHDIFTMADISRSVIKTDRPLTGERRTLVEEYYASINWRNEQDVDRFLRVVGYTIAQSYIMAPQKQYLRSICERESLIVDGINIHRKHTRQTSATAANPSDLALLLQKFLEISKLEPQQRGFAFEKFLNELFMLFGLTPRNSFRLVGEQIDGSFQINADTYLVEAKWQAKPTAQDDLLVFRGKVEAKSTWARGLFISINGFSDDGLAAFSRGKATNIIGMSGQDLYFVLTGGLSLADTINQKARRAVETGDFFAPIFDIMRS
ncbi:MAG TPA: restriction endonuclease [Roseiflexaceae bacterium]|nr:restriction endonuclease [Roseiflexaceae bacterium]